MGGRDVQMRVLVVGMVEGEEEEIMGVCRKYE